MATIFNSTDCTTNRKNTGFSDCFADIKSILGFFIVSSSFKLDAAALASIPAALAALQAAAMNNSKGLRAYPVHRLKNPVDGSEDTTKQTFSDGSQAVVREGLMMWDFQVTNGGLCIHKSLRTHNQNGGFIIFYDADFTLYGWAKNKGELWGVPLEFLWTKPWRMNDGSNVTAYMVGMAFAPRYVNEAIAYAKLDSTIEAIQGLQDVTLGLTSFVDTTGVAQVTALLECGATNMAELYATELATPNAWVAINATNGSVVDILTVTVIGGSDPRFQITLDIEDADYPTDGDIIIKMASVSVLDGLGVEGFESDELVLTVTP